MQRMNRKQSFGSTTSLRRSSISAKDIQAIQAALQRQQRISTQLIWLLIIVLPIFTFIYLYSIHLHRGAFMITFQSLFARWPFLLQVLPPFNDVIAWKFTAVLISLQLLLHIVLPHDSVLVMSSGGDYRRNVNGFSCFVLVCLLYVLGSGLGLYRGDLVFLHFNSIILSLACISIMILLAMIVIYRLGHNYNITTLPELYFGVELHPMILDIDVKHFLRSGITFTLWPLFIISALYYQITVQGKIMKPMMGLAITQMTYIAKYHWNEDIALNSLDNRRSHCGFFRLWSDLVFFPVMYSSPVAVVVHTSRPLGLLPTLIFSFIGLLSIYITSAADRQRYEFRRTKGTLKIGGVDAFFISAKYKTDSGESAASLLLGSGYWSYCRHPNYFTEIITFVSFAALQGYAPPIAYLPPLFIAGYLLVRLLNDESRCLVKYGQYWIQYCCKVPFRILPGVY